MVRPTTLSTPDSDAREGLRQGVLVDSDVLIWLLRGNPKALAHMQGLVDWHISAVSYMELVQGCRNKAELKTIQKVFKSTGSDVLPITVAVSDMACKLVETYALSHSLFMADALIAATAVCYSLPLLTANNKHFGAVAGLEIQVFRP